MSEKKKPPLNPSEEKKPPLTPFERRKLPSPDVATEFMKACKRMGEAIKAGKE